MKINFKKIWKHTTSALLVAIVLILLIPSWRVSFQGWFQGVFMGDLEFHASTSIPLPNSVENWQFKNIAEEEFQLKDLKGKPLVISFWATWCPPCRSELKELKKLYAQFSESIYFLSISEESIETIKKSGLQKDYSFLYSTTTYPAFFQINSYPTISIINSNRELIFKHSGAGQLDNKKNMFFLKELIENR